jgi:hypothetical protein
MSNLRQRTVQHSERDNNHLEEEVSRTERYIFSYLKLRRQFRLKMLALFFVGVFLIVASYFVFPREIVFNTEDVVLSDFHIDFGFDNVSGSLLLLSCRISLFSFQIIRDLSLVVNALLCCFIFRVVSR